MNYYTKVKSKDDIMKLEGVKIKEGLTCKFDLFFKSTNHSLNHLLQTGRSVLYVRFDMVDSGNLDCIPKTWEELSYDDFVKRISSNDLNQVERNNKETKS